MSSPIDPRRPEAAEPRDGRVPDVWWTPISIDGPMSLEPPPYVISNQRDEE